MSFAADAGFGFSGPPRWVPLLVRMRLWFGGRANQLGWFFLGIGMLIFWMIDLPTSIYHLVYFRGPLTTADATILEAKKTIVNDDNKAIWKYCFQFSVAGKPYEGASFEHGNTLAAGDQVEVQYPTGKPELARIQGMLPTLFDSPAIFLLLIPIAGLMTIAYARRSSRRAAKLLANGILTTGKLVSREATNSSVDKKRVYSLTFAFQTAAGEARQLTISTHVIDPLLDDSAEPLIYDPHDPSTATLLDHIPGQPYIDAPGEIRLKKPGRTILCLVLPLVTVGGSVAYVYWKYLA